MDSLWMEVPSPDGETSRVIESEVVMEAEKAEALLVLDWVMNRKQATSSPSVAKRFVFVCILNTFYFNEWPLMVLLYSACE